MALYSVSNGMSINSTDLDQIVNELQKASGVQEAGNYFLAGNTNQTAGVISNWVTFRSRYSTPVSATIDTSTLASTGGAGSPATSNLAVNGFQVWFGVASPPQGNARCGGAYTIQF